MTVPQSIRARELRQARRKRTKAATKARIDSLRAVTRCEVCGAQPIDWHSDDHVAHPYRRISARVHVGHKAETVLAEIARCRALCRACHMRADGRTALLHARKPHQPGSCAPPKPCAQCGRLAKPLRKGICSRCYDRKRRPARLLTCDRCGKRRKVGLVRGATLYCTVCAGLMRDAGLLDEVVDDEA